MTQPRAVQRVGVLGAGTIGASWTAWFLARGMTVDVWDPRPEAEAYVRRTIADAWPAMARLGMAAGASPETWQFVATPEAAVQAAPIPMGREFGFCLHRQRAGRMQNGPEAEDGETLELRQLIPLLP